MFQFTEDCLIGITEIDEEHKRLFDLINEAEKFLKESGSEKVVTSGVIKELQKYAATHFAHEEAYMEKIKDPELLRQKKEHTEFTSKVSQMTEDNTDMEEILKYLAGWLYKHILGSDIMIGKFSEEGKGEDRFAFTEEYYTGIEMVDEEHKKLFDIIRQTHEVMQAEFLHDKYDEIMTLLGQLKEYTIVHFGDEEAYMERIGYDGLEAQKRAHQAFVDRLDAINLDEVDENQDAYLEELIQFLLGWLTNHIKMVDKKIPVV